MRRIVLSTLLTGALLGVTGGALAAQQVVGRVINTTSMTALAGAKVTVVGSKRSTVTDHEGFFTLKGLPTGKLSIRVEKAGFVGMVEEVDVEPDAVTLVRFEVPAVGAFLDELTAVVHRKRAGDDQGEAVVQGGSHDNRYQTALDLLTYRIPGVVVTPDGGAPGHGFRVLIRGVSSLSLSNEPAVYVDGVRTHSVDELRNIPANDVERIRVLRGAASSTLYPDGANGVILIETRGGPSGKGNAP
ncbi:MAG: TonB-dependent receptor plug domain-containing protein [Gemmatimonadetes bacterium]|nr:TonB-dependent receptor plug domain-containing protein [Gemmatimonadota bacterium]